MKKFNLKNIRNTLLKGVIVLTITIALLELCYRYQVIDFYKTEWKYLNKNVNNQQNKTKVLVLGDSFSSAQNSWVEQLRKIDTNRSYYNGSFPGVATETYRLIAKRRIEEINPDKVIIQLYVGNDLLDVQKPINWSKLSFSRNLFWSFSNHIRFLNYFNYRMGQISQDVVKDNNPKVEDGFSVEQYSGRTLLYIEAMPTYPRNLITIEDKETFEVLVGHINEIKQLAEGKAVYILLIPHCTEVGEQYIKHYQAMGAQLPENNLKQNYWEKELLANGFEVINPSDYFREIEKEGQSIYYQNDPHLNDEGQSYLAKIIYNVFQGV